MTKLKIRLAHHPKENIIMAHTIELPEGEKEGKIIFSEDVTNDFIGSVIKMFGGGIQTVEGKDKIYTISVQEIPKKKTNILKK